MRALDPLVHAVLADLDENEMTELRLRLGAKLDSAAPIEWWRGHSFGAVLEQAGKAPTLLRSALAAVVNARRGRR